MAQCERCGRPLKTPQSLKVGFGSICKKKHDAAEAEFLKIQVTIDEELAYLERVKR